MKHNLQIQFHHGYMEQLKLTNLKRTIPCVLYTTIGTPPYGIPKYLVKIIQPTLNKTQHKTKNSVEFVSKTKTWKISATEIQV